IPNVQDLGSQPIPGALADNIDQLIDVAMRNRPDLTAKVSAVRAANAEVQLKKAAFYPTLDAFGYYGSHAFSYRLSNPPTHQFNEMVPEYAALLTLKWDLFTGFGRANALKEAESNRAAARADLQTLEVDIASEVWRAYYEFKTALKRYKFAQALMAASESSYQSNLKSYQNGLATITDLLDAEKQLASARYALIKSKADTLIAAAAIAYATGAMPETAPR